MTTNHPANGPVSLDRLHQISEILSKAVTQSDGGNLGYAMADAVKVIDGAIAAFGAEPAPVDIEMLATVLRNAPLAPSDRQGRPRAPVMPEECKEAPAYIKALTKEGAYIYGFNACRAAMLQAGNHTEQYLDMVDHSGDANEKANCRLPFAQWLSQQNEPIDVDCGCVTTEAFYHWLRVAYEAGNSPVIPDGWVMVPEDPTHEMLEAGDEQFGTYDVYRRMIAAAPQQEVK
ncbi:hypothetical protein [Citrobacter freundii]|uniref:hypothetical protein n=1 Tax=Citrobacter freundii TaxID=546 RepID=UPI00200F81A7|nr:hypothetical protein [Citrobacter freundii]UQI38532.1 hypothetical protein M3L74_12585 [Citrobacter freundii]